MRTYVVVSCLMAVASAQFQPMGAPPQHRFAAPDPDITVHPAHTAFDATSFIGSLHDRHYASNPTPAPRPATRRAPAPRPQQHQQPHHQNHIMETFTLQEQFGAPRPQVQPQQFAPRPQQFAPRPPPVHTPQFAQPQPANPNVITHNKDGLLINPRGHAGPLAHTEPSGLTGIVEHTQFTPEVAAAHRALAEAHAHALALQAALPAPLA